MGGTITHLVIADKILNKIPAGTISNAGLFYAGSLAPDAIHARGGYVRAMKKHTHLRDDIWDRDFMLPENKLLFHKRLLSFINLNRSRTGGLLDAYRGYLCHLLSDEIFVSSARKKLVELLLLEGIGQREPKFIEKFAPEVHNNDLILARSYDRISDIKSSLETVRSFDIEDYLTADEIERSRNWVTDNFLIDPRVPDDPTYITPEDINIYIDKSVDYTIDYLKSHKLL